MIEDNGPILAKKLMSDYIRLHLKYLCYKQQSILFQCVSPGRVGDCCSHSIAAGGDTTVAGNHYYSLFE